MELSSTALIEQKNKNKQTHRQKFIVVKCLGYGASLFGFESLSVTRYVTLDEFLNLSMPLFFHLSDGYNNSS